jgi:hypothetical protein
VNGGDELAASSMPVPTLLYENFPTQLPGSVVKMEDGLFEYSGVCLAPALFGEGCLP